jgi:hypothetical protein
LQEGNENIFMQQKSGSISAAALHDEIVWF